MSAAHARFVVFVRAQQARLFALVTLLLTVVCNPPLAHAGDIEDFQAARALYDAHDWPRAIAAFEALVGGETPTLESQPLVLESRKYLAAAYVFVGREGAASDQIERLLLAEPTYELDPTEFPNEVVQLFDRVRQRLAERRETQAERARLGAEVERLTAENAAMRRELEGERTVEVPRSQWLVQIPFGVGQFENGEEGLGWFFAGTELLATAAFVTSMILYQAYVNEMHDLEMFGRDLGHIDQVNMALRILNVVNWSSAGLLAAFALGGVIQANVRFSPTRIVHVPGRVSVELGPSFVGLTGSF
ncbi:MAG: hypothetical protein K1X94_09380 [Sandaracinaceae bacterium]|nr:hypothetical protein [Sandaracinaceae bacterium]